MSCQCSCDYESDYTAWIWKTEIVRARKDHVCSGCGLLIGKGDFYSRHTSNYDDGVPFTNKSCIYCHYLSVAYRDICGCAPNRNVSINAEIAETFREDCHGANGRRFNRPMSIYRLPYEIRGILIMRLMAQAEQYKRGIGIERAVRFRRGARVRYMLPRKPTRLQLSSQCGLLGGILLHLHGASL